MSKQKFVNLLPGGRELTRTGSWANRIVVEDGVSVEDDIRIRIEDGFLKVVKDSEGLSPNCFDEAIIDDESGEEVIWFVTDTVGFPWTVRSKVKITPIDGGYLGAVLIGVASVKMPDGEFFRISRGVSSETDEFYYNKGGEFRPFHHYKDIKDKLLGLSVRQRFFFVKDGVETADMDFNKFSKGGTVEQWHLDQGQLQAKYDSEKAAKSAKKEAELKRKDQENRSFNRVWNKHVSEEKAARREKLRERSEGTEKKPRNYTTTKSEPSGPVRRGAEFQDLLQGLKG